MRPPAFDAIILAGGRSSRFGGGGNKALLSVGEETLLARVVRAVQGARLVAVVAPVATVNEARLTRPIIQTLEDPPFGGPVAGILAGLAAIERAEGDAAAPLTAILACDLPLAPAAVTHLLADPQLARLGAAAPGRAAGFITAAQGLCALTSAGWPERLLGFYRTEYLRERAASCGSGHDLSVRRFIGDGPLLTTRMPGDYAGDIDTQADWRRHRKREESRSEND